MGDLSSSWGQSLGFVRCVAYGHRPLTVGSPAGDPGLAVRHVHDLVAQRFHREFNRRCYLEVVVDDEYSQDAILLLPSGLDGHRGYCFLGFDWVVTLGRFLSGGFIGPAGNASSADRLAMATALARPGRLELAFGGFAGAGSCNCSFAIFGKSACGVGASGMSLWGGSPMLSLAHGSSASTRHIRECWGFDSMYNQGSDRSCGVWADRNPGSRLFVYYLAGTQTAALSESLSRLRKRNVQVIRSGAGAHDFVPVHHLPERLAALG